jgi:hypothetical protein
MEHSLSSKSAETQTCNEVYWLKCGYSAQNLSALFWPLQSSPLPRNVRQESFSAKALSAYYFSSVASFTILAAAWLASSLQLCRAKSRRSCSRASPIFFRWDMNFAPQAVQRPEAVAPSILFLIWSDPSVMPSVSHQFVNLTNPVEIQTAPLPPKPNG